MQVNEETDLGISKFASKFLLLEKKVIKRKNYYRA